MQVGEDMAEKEPIENRMTLLDDQLITFRPWPA